MSIEREGETLYKVVFVGPRGLPARVLEEIRRHWDAEGWIREDGLGEPGEPVIDMSLCQVAFDGTRRVYFFGQGIAPDDFFILGPETRRAMFKGADRVVFALAGATSAGSFVDGVDRAFPEGARPPIEFLVLDGPPLVYGAPPEALVMEMGDDPAGWLDAMSLRLLGA